MRELLRRSNKDLVKWCKAVLALKSLVNGLTAESADWHSGVGCLVMAWNAASQEASQSGLASSLVAARDEIAAETAAATRLIEAKIRDAKDWLTFRLEVLL